MRKKITGVFIPSKWVKNEKDRQAVEHWLKEVRKLPKKKGKGIWLEPKQESANKEDKEK